MMKRKDIRCKNYIKYIFKLKDTTFFRIPKTGSIKMIDIWKIISLAFPFAEIILHSIIHVLNQKYNITNNQDMVVQIDRTFEKPKLGYQKLLKIVKNIATYGLPFAYTIFLIGYISYPKLL